MPTTSLRVLHTTREEWSKELHNETLESHPLLKLLNEKKRVTYGHSGTKLKWTVKFKQLALTPYADMQALSWERNLLTKTAELDYRGYKVVDAISEFEKFQNRGGVEAVIDLFSDKASRMAEDANDRLCAEFYVDGNATGNTLRLHGIESMMSISTQTAGDALATTLNDTYAGLSTAKGTYESDSTASGYDFWSPTIVSTNPTGKTWATHADEFIRRGIVEQRRTQKPNEQLDMFLVGRSDYYTLLNLLDDKERVMVTNGDQGIRKFGFKEVVNIDGVDVSFDPDIPTPDGASDVVRGYGFNTSKMELCLMSKKGNFWDASGDAFDETTMAFRFWLGFYGNLKFSPRHFVKLADIA